MIQHQLADSGAPIAGVRLPAAARRRRWLSRLLTAAAAGVAVAVIVVGGAGWKLTGGSWMVIATPSMGHAAPVGTLVLTRPTSTAQLRVGAVVSYRSPAKRGETITHRVVRVDHTGAVHTRGDINGAEDPWALTDRDLVGVVVATWPGVGWLLRAVPLLAIGGTVLWLGSTLWLPVVWRPAVRLFGAAALFSLVALLLKPFVQVVLLSTQSRAGGTRTSIVSTGLLPIRVSVPGGQHVDLADGQVGVLTARAGTPGGGAALTSTLHMPAGWWAVTVLFWCTPLLWAVLRSAAADPKHPDDAPDGPGRCGAAADRRPPPAARRRTRRRRAGRTAMLLMLPAVLLTTTQTAQPSAAAFTAAIHNSANTAASAGYFTCAASLPAIGAPSLIWYLTETTTNSGAAAADVSGKARPGVYSAGITHSSSPACVRDAGGSASFTGTTANVLWNTLITAPTTFTEIIWFKTASTRGGRLLGFGSSNTQTGTSTNPDRHLYLSDTGKLVFGVLNGTSKVVATSPLSYNNGTWHQAAASLSPTSGMRLYADGALVATNPNTAAGTSLGYFRVGWDTLTGWAPTSTNSYFTGNLGFFALYNTELTAAAIQTQYISGS